MLAQAATGTGKTAAFALPMLHRCWRAAPSGPRRTRGLVLVPTRELAMQVAEAIHKYARSSGLRVVPVYGGAPMSQQIRALERGADIVVATPGRALDHIRRKHARPRRAARARARRGRRDARHGLCRGSRRHPRGDARGRDRRRCFPRRCRRGSSRSPSGTSTTRSGSRSRARRRRPASCRAFGRSPTSSRARRSPRRCSACSTWRAPTSALVFCRTRLEVDTLVETLNAHGYRAEALHGGMQQRQRDRVMNRFRAGQGGPADRDRRRGPRPRHRAAVARRQLRRAVAPQRPTSTASAAPAAPAATARRSRSPSRASTGCCARIEQFTKQKIEVATVPTVADLRAKRLELTRVVAPRADPRGRSRRCPGGRRIAGRGVRRARRGGSGGEARPRGRGGGGR